MEGPCDEISNGPADTDDKSETQSHSFSTAEDEEFFSMEDVEERHVVVSEAIGGKSTSPHNLKSGNRRKNVRGLKLEGWNTVRWWYLSCQYRA